MSRVGAGKWLKGGRRWTGLWRRARNAVGMPVHQVMPGRRGRREKGDFGVGRSKLEVDYCLTVKLLWLVVRSRIAAAFPVGRGGNRSSNRGVGDDGVFRRSGGLLAEVAGLAWLAMLATRSGWRSSRLCLPAPSFEVGGSRVAADAGIAALRRLGRGFTRVSFRLRGDPGSGRVLRRWRAV